MKSMLALIEKRETGAAHDEMLAVKRRIRLLDAQAETH